VNTLAGSGAASFADTNIAAGIKAGFNNPGGIAVDSAGNLFVADSTNHRIRKIDPNGNVTTLAGSGTAGYSDATGTAAQFNNPQGVAVDSAGNVYIADTGNHRIRKISPLGVVGTLAGTGAASFANGAGNTSTFNSPQGVAVDSDGVVYVADTTNQRIRKIITVSGVTTVSTLSGDGTYEFKDGPGINAKFRAPCGLAVGPDKTVYVADTYN